MSSPEQSISLDSMSEVERSLPAYPTKEQQSPLEQASLDALELLLKPNRKYAPQYRGKFEQHIEQAHEENPLVSRSLLARFAIADVASGKYLSAVITEVETQAAKELLNSEEIWL